MVTVDMLTAHSYMTSKSTTGLSCTFGHNKQRGRRQTDRQRHCDLNEQVDNALDVSAKNANQLLFLK